MRREWWHRVGLCSVMHCLLFLQCAVRASTSFAPTFPHSPVKRIWSVQEHFKQFDTHTNIIFCLCIQQLVKKQQQQQKRKYSQAPNLFVSLTKSYLIKIEFLMEPYFSFIRDLARESRALIFTFYRHFEGGGHEYVLFGFLEVRFDLKSFYPPEIIVAFSFRLRETTHKYLGTKKKNKTKNSLETKQK